MRLLSGLFYVLLDLKKYLYKVTRGDKRKVPTDD